MINDILDELTRAAQERTYKPINYAERLFKVKQLEYKIKDIECLYNRLSVSDRSLDHHYLKQIKYINSQISELLKDE